MISTALMGGSPGPGVDMSGWEVILVEQIAHTVDAAAPQLLVVIEYGAGSA